VKKKGKSEKKNWRAVKRNITFVKWGTEENFPLLKPVGSARLSLVYLYDI
jgi:hypothetical protein